MSKLSVIFKDRILSQYQLNKEKTFSIGNQQSCDLFIDSLIFKPIHATIYTENNKFTFALNHEEGAEAQLNRKEINKPFILKDGDNIEVGKYIIRFVEEVELNHRDSVPTPFESIQKTKRTFWLQFLNGKNVGKSIPIKQTIANIGKAGTARVALTKKEEDYYVSHLDGINDARVNQKPIGEQEVLLQNNSTLEMGQIKMLFYFEEK